MSANGTSLGYFYQEIVLDSNFYRDSVLTASTLFNLVLCWIANRRGWERMGQGLLAVVLPTVPLIVYFQEFRHRMVRARTPIRRGSFERLFGGWRSLG